MALTSVLPPLQELQVRTLDGQRDFQQAEEVQRQIWGCCERDVVPSSIFSVARNFGGQAIGALAGDRMVGFALSFCSAVHGHAHLHSHMVGVIPEFQNRGLGKCIWLAQREDALSRGFDQMMWTYDPLQTRNAHFNITLLGGIGRTYLPNIYGNTSSPLHGGMPTDRVVIEWNLTSQRVMAVLSGEPRRLSESAIDVRTPAAAGDCRTPIQDRLVAQAILRDHLIDLFHDGFAITGFRQDQNDAIYSLERITSPLYS